MLGQEIPMSITDQIEAFLEEQDEDVDITELYDRLVNYYKSPLDINKSDQEDLVDLRLLSQTQINDLQIHISKYGQLISLEELQSIPSFTINDIRRIRPFLTVKDPNKINLTIPQMLLESQNLLFLKWGTFLEQKKGFTKNTDGSSRYLGDDNKIFVRFKNNYENKLRLGFTLENDAGEPFMQSAKNAGFDYFTFHAYLKDYTTLLKDVALGDYTISLGQGLIAHNSFGSGKSAYVTNIKRGGRVIKPFNSLNENGYMRGAAVTLRLKKNIELSIFGSSARRDGNPTDTIQVDEGIQLRFSSLQTSGNHRTENEILDKRAIGINSAGGSLKYKKRNFHVALNGISHRFDQSLNRTERLYNKYRYNGNSLSNVSLDYSFRLRNINLFGESAYSSTGGVAHLAGALIGLHKDVSLAFLYRNYAIDYNALEPNAFGESAAVQNENGIYMGLEYVLSKNWQISVYADHWSHPWLRFNVSKPSKGSEYVAKVDFALKRRMNVYLQYTYENKEQDYARSDEEFIKPTGYQIRHRLRWHFSNIVSKSLTLRTRLEFSRFENPTENQSGYLFYQDFIYRPDESPFSMTARVAFFDTDDFDSRIFAFENSILYDFSIPSYFDQGVRYYINLRHQITRKLTAEFRLARTYYTRLDQQNDPDSRYFIDAIGSSGNEQILGNTKTEIKVQLRYSF